MSGSLNSVWKDMRKFLQYTWVWVDVCDCLLFVLSIEREGGGGGERETESERVSVLIYRMRCVDAFVVQISQRFKTCLSAPTT